MQGDNKIIAGAGITGLVWNFYHPEFKIISPEVGGNFTRTYLVWLHDNGYTRKLLEDLGFKHPEKFAKKSFIGYYVDGWISDYQTDWLAKKIIQRKMTEWNRGIDETLELKDRDLSNSTPSTGNWMNTLDVDLEEVIRRLSSKVNIEQGFITKIEPQFIHIKKDLKSDSVEIRPYSKLVTTMAAPMFWQAYGTPKDTFKSLPITNVIVNKRPPLFDDDYDMVYFYDKPYSRISHLRGKWAIEYTGVIPKEEVTKDFPDIVDYFVVKHGRIWENENESPQENIIFSGRFSQWKHKIVTESVISQAIEYHA